MAHDAGIPESGTTPRVLVVDDELKNRELVRDLLEVNGYQVIEAENGEQALALVRDERPDVVLLDVMMPGLDGFEVCRRLKANLATAPTPVLLVTALKERNDRITGIDAGANDFLTKPIDSQEVVLRTRNAVFTKKLYDQVQESYAKLKELEALRDNLTHMIVHDLRSPLTGIMGYLELLQGRATSKLGEKETEYLVRARASCSTLVEMISSLLDVNRLETGEMPLNRADCDLRAVADEAVKTLGAAVETVQLVIDRSKTPIEVNCDSELIRRVIANLLSNAIKFSSGREVRLVLEERQDRVRVSVRDSGPGIPPEYHQKIFEKFGQVEARRDGKKYSTGLGLTFCKLAVEAHAGKIGLESPEGSGSTFWFDLPVRPQERM